MLINSKEDLTKAICELDRQCITQKDALVNTMQSIKQSFDPVYRLNKLLRRKRKQPPQIFDRLIDESMNGVADSITNKISLKNGSFMTAKANSFLQLTIDKIFAGNRYKVKAITIAILKNIFK